MNLSQDLRYGLRALRNSPGFAVTAIVTMALGIGATTAIFSVCDAMLWKPAPLPRLDSLAMVLEAAGGDPDDWNSATPADIEDVRQQSRILQSVAAWQDGTANLAGTGEPDRVFQALVTANFFDVIGVKAAHGRVFAKGEDQPGREREVVLSDGLWRRRYGADPNMIGRTVLLDDRDYTVIGVMPPEFAFPLASELWTPMALTPTLRNTRRSHSLQAAARLKPGYSIAQAAAEIDEIAKRLEKIYPDTNKNRRFHVWPAMRFLVEHETRQYMLMLLGSVLFVLLIACVNVANLQFARGSTRVRELGVRRALGAGRWRVISQLVTESVLLALIGAGLGLLIAYAGVAAMRNGMPAEVQRYIYGWKDIHIDADALLFAVLASFASGVIAGAAPAWQFSHPNLTDTLKEGGRSSSVGAARQRLRSCLVAAEIALALILLVGAGLMVRGFQALVKAGENLQPSTLLTMRLAVTDEKYSRPDQVADFYRDILERLQTLPGVRSAATASALPFSDHSNSRHFAIEGRPIEPGNELSAMYQAVSPTYFDTLRIRLRQGRVFDSRDGAQSPKVAVISERMARMWWKNESPIGKRIKVDERGSYTAWTSIVGVVGDTMHNPYDRVPRPTLYVSYRQAPALWMDVAVRTYGDPSAQVPSAITAIHSVDRQQPVTEIRTMAKLIHNRAIGLNYMAALMGAFGGIALILSVVGVYGVMAYLVSEQKQQIGIRMALGSPRSSVLALIFRRGMFTAGTGLAIGLPVAYLFSRLMASLIYGVAANDPATFLGITLALMTAAGLAVYIPAVRATRIDPIVALRYE